MVVPLKVQKILRQKQIGQFKYISQYVLNMYLLMSADSNDWNSQKFVEIEVCLFNK